MSSLRPLVEQLEARELMASRLTATLDGAGVFRIEGTERNDMILVRQVNQQISIANLASIRTPDGPSRTVRASRVKSFVVHGLGGDDTVDLTASGGAQQIIVPATLSGGAGKDKLSGGAGHDILLGGAGSDILRGNPGDDILIGESGNDTISGGAGFDMLKETGNVDFTLTDALLIGNGTDTLSSIEVAILVGGAGNNRIDASAFSGNVTLEGGAGDDELRAAKGHSRLIGGAGKFDFLVGNGTSTEFFGGQHAGTRFKNRPVVQPPQGPIQAAYLKPTELDRAAFMQAYQEEFGEALPAAVQTKLWQLVEFLRDDAAITDIRWMAYMLATAKLETIGFDPAIPEQRGGANQDNPYWTVDGGRYYGRGYVQITWKTAYEEMGQALGIDLVGNPELACDPATAYRIFSYGMRTGFFNDVNWLKTENSGEGNAHQWKGLHHYFNDDQTDYYGAREMVNFFSTGTYDPGRQHAEKFERIIRRISEPSGKLNRLLELLQKITDTLIAGTEQVLGKNDAAFAGSEGRGVAVATQQPAVPRAVRNGHLDLNLPIVGRALSKLNLAESLDGVFEVSLTTPTTVAELRAQLETLGLSVEYLAAELEPDAAGDLLRVRAKERLVVAVDLSVLSSTGIDEFDKYFAQGSVSGALDTANVSVEIDVVFGVDESGFYVSDASAARSVGFHTTGSFSGEITDGQLITASARGDLDVTLAGSITVVDVDGMADGKARAAELATGTAWGIAATGHVHVDDIQFSVQVGSLPPVAGSAWFHADLDTSAGPPVSTSFDVTVPFFTLEQPLEILKQGMSQVQTHAERIISKIFGPDLRLISGSLDEAFPIGSELASIFASQPGASSPIDSVRSYLEAHGFRVERFETTPEGGTNDLIRVTWQHTQTVAALSELGFAGLGLTGFDYLDSGVAGLLGGDDTTFSDVPLTIQITFGVDRVGENTEFFIADSSFVQLGETQFSTGVSGNVTIKRLADVSVEATLQAALSGALRFTDTDSVADGKVRLAELLNLQGVDGDLRGFVRLGEKDKSEIQLHAVVPILGDLRWSGWFELTIDENGIHSDWGLREPDARDLAQGILNKLFAFAPNIPFLAEINKLRNSEVGIPGLGGVTVGSMLNTLAERKLSFLSALDWLNNSPLTVTAVDALGLTELKKTLEPYGIALDIADEPATKVSQLIRGEPVQLVSFKKSGSDRWSDGKDILLGAFPIGPFVASVSLSFSGYVGYSYHVGLGVDTTGLWIDPNSHISVEAGVRTGIQGEVSLAGIIGLSLEVGAHVGAHAGVGLNDPDPRDGKIYLDEITSSNRTLFGDILKFRYGAEAGLYVKAELNLPWPLPDITLIDQTIASAKIGPQEDKDAQLEYQTNTQTGTYRPRTLVTDTALDPERARVENRAGLRTLVLDGTELADVVAIGKKDGAVFVSWDGRTGKFENIQRVHFEGKGETDMLRVGPDFDVSIEAHGGEGNDVLEGGTAGDALYGEEGDDRLSGRQGGDTLDGGDNDDMLDGGGDGDTLYGRGGNDDLRGGAGRDFGYGGSGDDYLQGDHGDDELHGDDGNDILAGGEGDDDLKGGAQRDYLIGGEHNDQLYGEGDKDILLGGQGDDPVLDGGAGDDSIDGGDGNDMIYGRAGNDQLTGGAGADTIFGNDGNDVLNGGADLDTLYGDDKDGREQGEDRFEIDFATNQATFSDVFHGGLLSDQVVVVGFETMDALQHQASQLDQHPEADQTGAKVKLKKSASGAFELTDAAKAQSGHDVITVTQEPGTETFVVTWQDNNDASKSRTVRFSLAERTNADELMIDSRSGDDRIVVSESTELKMSILGGDGDDLIQGGSGNERIFGGAGADTICGGKGEDEIHGGAGRDRIDGEQGSDVVYGEEEADFLTGGADRDLAYGGSGNDVISAGPGIHGDLMYGLDGADTLLGGAGVDVIDGGNQNDTILGGDLLDVIFGGEGHDTLAGEAGIDFLFGNGGDDDMWAEDAPALRQNVLDRLTPETRAFLHLEASASQVSVEQMAEEYVTYLEARIAVEVDPGNRQILESTLQYVKQTMSRRASGPWTPAEETVLSMLLQRGILEKQAEKLRLVYSLYAWQELSGAPLTEDEKRQLRETADSLAANLLSQLAGIPQQKVLVEILDGGADHDELHGGIRADLLNGNSGDDKLYHSPNDDVIAGGEGNDTYIVHGTPDDDTIDFKYEFGTGHVVVTIDAPGRSMKSTDTLGLPTGLQAIRIEHLEIENYQVAGMGGDDKITTAGLGAYVPSDTYQNSVQIKIFGDDEGGMVTGNDRIDASNYEGPLMLWGGDGADHIWGGKAGSTIFGGAPSVYDAATARADDLPGDPDGGDRLYGGVNADIIYGGGGDDHLSGGSGTDLLDGGTGDDVISGGDDGDRLQGGLGEDDLDGGSGDDWLHGGEDADRIDGGEDQDTITEDGTGDRSGDDELDGGPGNDVVYAGDGDDQVFGGTGSDRLFGQAGNDRLEGGNDNDRVDGGEGNDTIVEKDPVPPPLGLPLLPVIGIPGLPPAWSAMPKLPEPKVWSGNDELDGGPGDDYIYAAIGNDHLFGGGGADRLDGGSGDDTLNGGSEGDTVNGGDGHDLITEEGAGDGSGNDTLFGDGGDDTIHAGAGDDHLWGGDGYDELFGEAGRDSIDGVVVEDSYNPRSFFFQGQGGGGFRYLFSYNRQRDGQYAPLTYVDPRRPWQELYQSPPPRYEVPGQGVNSGTIWLHTMHPGDGGRMAIIGWQSPTSGLVRVHGYFEDLDGGRTGSDGGGIGWFVDHNSSPSRVGNDDANGRPGQLATNTIPNGGGRHNYDLTIPISAGDWLYFGVDPQTTYHNDTTGYDINIDFLKLGDRYRPQAGLDGTYFFNGSCNVLDSGTGALTFTNERGHSTTGRWLSPNRVRADGWCDGTVEFGNGYRRIYWDNGTFWDTRTGLLAGEYSYNGLCRVIETDVGNLTFVNEHGHAVGGRWLTANLVIADGWGGLPGDLVGREIRWRNGTTWSRN
jgi:Ca2+-binding RTX toxin-like protein